MLTEVLCALEDLDPLPIFRPGNTNWAHLSCALWIPEVRVGNVDKMEPITNVEAVPVSAHPITIPCL